MKKLISTSIILLLLIAVPLRSKAETDLVDEAKNFGKSVTDVKEFKDISGNDVADVVIKKVVGDIPSQTMSNLLSQVQKQFLPYTTETAVDGKQVTQCQRAANLNTWSIFLDGRAKAHFAPWVLIAWDAVKDIAGGGKSIGKLIEENTKAKLAELMKKWLNTSSALPVETVNLSYSGDCNKQVKYVWNPQEKKFSIDVTGNCGCTTVNTQRGGGKVKLNSYKIHMEAPVEAVNVKIEEENYFIFWKTHTMQVQYKVGKLKVATEAECNKKCPTDQPPPPPKKKKGFFRGIIDWIFGGDDGAGGDPVTPLPPKDGTDEKKDKDKDKGGEEKKDDGKDDGADDKEDGKKDGKNKEDEKKLSNECGKIDILGQTGVTTFDERTDETKLCNNSCKAHQKCEGVPAEYVGGNIYCTYCANVCDEGQYRNAHLCNANMGKDQECVPTGKGDCHELKDKEKKEEPPKAGGCEGVVRKILDEYLGWAVPQVTFSGNGAVFTVPGHRCLSESEFAKYHSALVDQGVKDLKGECPSLVHVSSSENQLSGGGKGALCESKTVFSF